MFGNLVRKRSITPHPRKWQKSVYIVWAFQCRPASIFRFQLQLATSLPSGGEILHFFQKSWTRLNSLINCFFFFFATGWRNPKPRFSGEGLPEAEAVPRMPPAYSHPRLRLSRVQIRLSSGLRIKGKLVADLIKKDVKREVFRNGSCRWRISFYCSLFLFSIAQVLYFRLRRGDHVGIFEKGGDEIITRTRMLGSSAAWIGCLDHRATD